MLKAAFLFPGSKQLADKWWHRLAGVIFWLWLAIVGCWLAFGISYGVDLSCWRGEYGDFTMAQCDQNASAYALAYFLSRPVFTLAVLLGRSLLLLYLALLMPGLIYRVGLFVTRGESWKDHRGVGQI